ncbi:ABC transporter substrate-binding protein [Deminuibacter soli]|uniref:Leucine-binding protein domain-containing protein n=1 Tax=Deminuibacter soli TaxID=2291815 RepID=A0A3E1NKB5_9BACT|nr:ABC transporter substrate-binding protein [Deminuibacter soli]RFM28218.1 hypothetical protein DXN05_11920 [Deminuibacter soli]
MSVRIGFLLPYSSIYPDLYNNFIQGFQAALPPSLLQQQAFQFIPSFTKQGGVKDTLDAAQRLVFFDGVDILSGLISYTSLEILAPLLESRQKTGFFCDMGEYLLPLNHLSPRIFFNSFQYWQAEFSLGYWAHQTYGDRGMCIMSMYEAGYQMHCAFRQGTMAAGSAALEYSVMHNMPGHAQMKDNVKQALQKIRESKPSFLHTLFCGTESTDFLAAFAASDLNGKIPLLLSAHMASPEMLRQVKDLGLIAYAASMYNETNDSKLNRQFIQTYTSQAGTPVNHFALMGYETGLAMAKLHPYIQRKDWATVNRLLQTETFESPRGMRSYCHNAALASPVIDIEKISIGDGIMRKLVINQGITPLYNHQLFKDIHTERATGWQNPYLCV